MNSKKKAKYRNFNGQQSSSPAITGNYGTINDDYHYLAKTYDPATDELLPVDQGGGGGIIVGGGGSGGGATTYDGGATNAEIDAYDCPTLQQKIAEWQNILVTARFSDPAAYDAYVADIQYAQQRYNTSCLVDIPPPPPPPAGGDDGGIITPPPLEPVIQYEPPIANAGGNKSITLPADQIMLDGSQSFDPQGDSLQYAWSQISGPPGPVISGQTSNKATISQLLAGNYVFRLTVNNPTTGLSSFSDANVTVSLPNDNASDPVNPSTDDAGSHSAPISSPTIPALIVPLSPYSTSGVGAAPPGGGGGGGGGSDSGNAGKMYKLLWLIPVIVAISFIAFKKDTPPVGGVVK